MKERLEYANKARHLRTQKETKTAVAWSVHITKHIILVIHGMVYNIRR